MVYLEPMSLDLDTRVAIRHPDLGRIVQAVVGADEHDEAHWIEWKCGLGRVAVRVHNPSGRYLPKVMVELHFEWERVVSTEPDYDEEYLPAEPRPHGEPTPSPLARSLVISPLTYPSIISSSLGGNPLPPRSWIEEGSVKIVFNVGDLRQEGTDTSDDHYLPLPERPPDGILRGTWKATVPEVHGVIRGDLEVPVQDDPVDLRDLLDNEPDDQSDEGG